MKRLTKSILEEQGIEVIQLSDNEYEVGHTTPIKGKHQLGIKARSKKHKYGNDKTYLGVIFTHNGHSVGYVLSRLVYAGFIGDVPEGYEVDHIDNDPFNNRLDNLQLLTKTENLRKRPHNGANQHTPNLDPDHIFGKRKFEIKDRIAEIEKEVEDLKEVVRQKNYDISVLRKKGHELNAEKDALKKEYSFNLKRC